MMMRRKRKYIDIVCSQKKHKTLGRGRVVIFRLPGGTMMSMVLQNNVKYRHYLRAKDNFIEAKRALKMV